MEKLRQWIKSSGTNQRELAKKLEVSQAAVSLWVQGSSIPTGHRLRKLAEITSLSFDDLLGDYKSPKKKRAS